MVSAEARAIREQMRAQMGRPLRPLEEERSDWEAWVRGQKLPEGTLVSGTELNGVPCEWVERADSEPEIVLFVHGGGFNAGSPRTHRRFAASLAAACGRRVLLPDYRLAPEEPFPAGLDDVVAVYAALIEGGVEPAEIVVAGDSAGGGLAAATVLKLKELGAPQPAGLVLLSAWLDVSLTAGSLEQFASHPNPTRQELERAAGHYVGGRDRRDPLVSPVHADCSGFPPVLLEAGGSDVLVDDSVAFAAQARAAGVEVMLTVTPEMWHGFEQSDCPEARAAVERIAAFVGRVLEHPD